MVKLIGQMWCVHSPEVFPEGRYPYGLRCFTSASFAICPDCESTYTPLVTHLKIYPLCPFYFRFYVYKNYCGIMDICIMIHSVLSIWLLSSKYVTSVHTNLGLMSKMALLTCIFMVVKSDVGMLTSPV